MGHTIAQKEQLVERVRLVKEHLAAIEAAFRGGVNPADVLQLVAESRALLNGLMADILEDHLRVHVLQEDCRLPAGAQLAAEDLIQVVHAYMGH